MNEFFMALAALCQVHSSSNSATNMLEQRNCQRTIVRCIKEKMKADSTAYAWNVAFIKCVEE